jgi:hypothetical protein
MWLAKPRMLADIIIIVASLRLDVFNGQIDQQFKYQIHPSLLYETTVPIM